MDTSGAFPLLRTTDPLYEMADYTALMRTTLTPGAWSLVSLSNSWTHWTGSNWSGLRVATMGPLVMITGAAGKSSWSTADLMATLPVALRPPFQVHGNNCQLSTTGALAVGSSGATATSLSVVYFAA